MLEASGFDFRNRYPQRLVLKIAKHYHVDRDAVGKTAYNTCLDLYRTFAPLKQTTPTMAIACVELSGRICEQHVQDLETGKGYKKWRITRAEVMGTIPSYRNLLLYNTKPQCRDTSRPTRPVHPPPGLHHCRSRPRPRNVHQHPHRPEPRSLHQQNTSTYSN